MFLQGAGYAAVLRASGVLLLGVALWLARDGWRLLRG
jgi:hypothetical protein